MQIFLGLHTEKGYKDNRLQLWVDEQTSMGDEISSS